MCAPKARIGSRTEEWMLREDGHRTAQDVTALGPARIETRDGMVLRHKQPADDAHRGHGDEAHDAMHHAVRYEGKSRSNDDRRDDKKVARVRALSQEQQGRADHCGDDGGTELSPDVAKAQRNREADHGTSTVGRDDAEDGDRTQAVDDTSGSFVVPQNLRYPQ